MVPCPCSSMYGSTAWQHHSVGNSERRISASISVRLVVGIRLRPDRAADVVDQDVDPAEPFVCLGHDRRAVVVLLEVRDQRHGLGALGCQLLADLVHDLGPVDQGDRSALSGGPGRDRLAETLRRAGDDQDLVREATREDHVSAYFPSFSMPARIVALACSLWSTMTVRRASMSSRSIGVDHVDVILGDVADQLHRRGQHVAHVLLDQQLAVRLDQRGVAGGLDREQVERRRSSRGSRPGRRSVRP